MTINKLFDSLDLWKEFPAYQLERRVDIFFAIYLPQIIKAHQGLEIDFIIPEFPIQKDLLPFHEKFNPKTKQEKYRSFKVDYIIVTKEPNPEAFLVELKSEMESLNEKQNWYLKVASEKSASDLYSGVKAILSKSNKKDKYRNLLAVGAKLEALQVNPAVLYIQPINPDKLPCVISFEDVRRAIKDVNDPIALRFSQSLKKWEDEALEKHKKKRIKPNFINC